MRNEMPPDVCQARTVPIVWPAALISGIGAPPCGSAVTQPESGAKLSAAAAIATDNLWPMFVLNSSALAWFSLNFCQKLTLCDLLAFRRGKFGDEPIERGG